MNMEMIIRDDIGISPQSIHESNRLFILCGRLSHAVYQKEIEQTNHVKIYRTCPVLIMDGGYDMESVTTAAQRLGHYRNVGIQMSVSGTARNPVLIFFNLSDRKKPHTTTGNHWKFVRNPLIHSWHGVLLKTQQSH